MTIWKANWTGNLITTLWGTPIQRSDLIDGIDNSIKAKNQTSAAINMSAPGAHNLQSQTTLQVRVESSRETTYVLYLENLPRDSSYVSTSTSRIVVRVYLENNREGWPERGIESHQKLLSHRKARRSDHEVTTLQCCQHCLGKNSGATERQEIVVIKWQHCSAANTDRIPVLSQIVQ